MQSLLMRRPNLDDLPSLPVMPEGYTLRQVNEADGDALAALLKHAFADDQWTAARIEKELGRGAGVETTFVMECAGAIVATASARLLPEGFPGSGYVHWVAADEAHKGKRLGWVVTLATLHDFVRLGCKDAVLETDDARLPAIKTYLRLGFVPQYPDGEHVTRWSKIFTALR